MAAFNIASSLIMLVRAKTRDIAILRTMGATRVGMIKIFMTVGTTIGDARHRWQGWCLASPSSIFRQNVVDFVQWISGQNLWDPTIRYPDDPSVQARYVRDDRDNV